MKVTRKQMRELLERVPHWRVLVHDPILAGAMELWMQGHTWDRVGELYEMKGDTLRARVVGNTAFGKGSVYRKLVRASRGA